jgi:hypothetical protein
MTTLISDQGELEHRRSKGFTQSFGKEDTLLESEKQLVESD